MPGSAINGAVSVPDFPAAHASSASHTGPLFIRMLGCLVAERDGVVVAQLDGRRYGAILAQLAVRPGRAISRDVLVATHWPEVDPAVARNRLSVALNVLRKILGSANLFVADRACVALDPTQVVTDVQRFEHACSQARRATDPMARRTELEAAWALYGGPLLQGFEEDWIDTERERLACAHEDIEKALQIEEAVPTDPLPAPPPPPPPPPPEDRQQAPAPASTAPLPSPVTRFFGRAAELDSIVALVDQGARLLTILGLGGIGKTRLAIAAAGRLVAENRRGEALWVPIVDVRSEEALISALLTAAGGPAPIGDHRAALASRLAGRQAVLVIDNAEHLVDEVARTAAALLAAVPDLVVMATSQRALLIDGEHLLRLLSLTSSGVALVIDRIRLQRPDYLPGDDDQRALAAIVERLDGIPLALELAAAGLRQGPATALLEQLTPAGLRDRRRDRPSRQRSLVEALEWTLALLTPRLRQVFFRLSVFPGEISTEAARAVVGGHLTEDDLLELQDCSLLVPIAEAVGRARMLATVRTLADARLAEVDRSAAQESLRGWFLARTQRWKSSLLDGTARTLAPEMVRDQVNLERALELATPLEVADALIAIVIYILWTGRAREFLPRFDALAQHPEFTSWPIQTRSGLLCCGHRLAQVSGNGQAAAGWCERIQALLRDDEVSELIAINLWQEIALSAMDRGALGEAESTYISHCEFYSRHPEQKRGLAVTLDALSRVYYFMGHFERSLETSTRAAEVIADLADPQLQEAIDAIRLFCLIELEPERALEIIRQSPDPTRSLYDLAVAETRLNMPSAVDTAQRALLAASSDVRRTVFAQDVLAQALLQQGADEAALLYADAAAQGFRDLRRLFLLPRPLLIRARCQLRLGSPTADASILDAIQTTLAIEGRLHLPLLSGLVAERWPEHADTFLSARSEEGAWRSLLASWARSLGATA